LPYTAGPDAGRPRYASNTSTGARSWVEPGVYVSLEETTDDIIENMANTFPMINDVKDLMDDKKIEVIKPDKLNLEEVAGIIENSITENGAKRAVIDSSTMIRMSFKNEIEYRQTLFEFLSLLRGLDCTSMTTVEAVTASRDEMKYDIEHFVMDGIINLYNIGKEDRRIRALEIMKMRGTAHSRDLVPFKVTPSGIKVYVGEKVF